MMGRKTFEDGPSAPCFVRVVLLDSMDSVPDTGRDERKGAPVLEFPIPTLNIAHYPITTKKKTMSVNSMIMI